jgi:hypothetical protein
MNHKPKKPRASSFRPESLEPRGLLASGLSSGLNVVMELGEVSRAVALKGVEVAATIPAHGSITFEFETGAAGNYLLKIRHVGDDLTLEATGPSGSASINPGPAGPFFSTISLPLKAADYQIKASAGGDQPVFVDWELLLTSGVGQSAAIGATLVSPAATIPLAGLPGPASSLASATATPSSLASSTNWASAVSPSLVTTAGPIGRSDPARAIAPVGPTSPDGSLALAYAGDGLPVGALKALNPIAEEEAATSLEATSLFTLHAPADVQQDLLALETSWWVDRLAQFEVWAMSGPMGPESPGDQAAREGVEVVAAAASLVGDPLDGGAESSNASVMIVTGVITAAVARRWQAGRGLPPRRGKSPTKQSWFPPSRG